MSMSIRELRGEPTQEATTNHAASLGFALLVLAAVGCGAGLYHIVQRFGAPGAVTTERVVHAVKGLLGIQGQMSPSAARAAFAEDAAARESRAETGEAGDEIAEPAAESRPSHAARRF